MWGNGAPWKSIYDFLYYSPLKYAWPRFDLSRSLKVKANGAICKSMYDFLFNFNSLNHEAKCHRLEDTALWKQVT